MCISLSYLSLLKSYAFFKGGGGYVVSLSSLALSVASTCLIRSVVGAIHSPDQSRQVFEQYDASKVPQKFLGRLFDVLYEQFC